MQAFCLVQRFDPGLVADLPRILNPQRFGTVFQCDHIKTQVLELALTLLHPPQFGATHDTALFFAGNAFKCTAMAAVAALPHLHHHGGFALRHDEVDFAAAAAVVLGHQHKAFGFKQPKGLYFSLLALGQNGQFVCVWLNGCV